MGNNELTTAKFGPRICWTCIVQLDNAKKIQLYVQMSLLLIAECTKIIAGEGSSPYYPPECVVIWSFPNKVRAPEKCLISSRMSPEQKSSVNFVNFVGWVEWCVSRLEARGGGELFKKFQIQFSRLRFPMAWWITNSWPVIYFFMETITVRASVNESIEYAKSSTIDAVLYFTGDVWCVHNATSLTS